MLGLVLLVVACLLTTLGLAQERTEEPAAPPEEAPAEEPAAPAADEPELTVTAIICTSVEDREPVGAGQTFSSQVEKLYCHTLVEGAQEPTSVTHVWYYGEEEMAEVTLLVNSPHWRTWSSKRIIDSWTGDWQVQVLSERGDVLTAISFQIQ
jgi:hypothetical protein